MLTCPNPIQSSRTCVSFFHVRSFFLFISVFLCKMHVTYCEADENKIESCAIQNSSPSFSVWFGLVQFSSWNFRRVQCAYTKTHFIIFIAFSLCLTSSLSFTNVFDWIMRENHYSLKRNKSTNKRKEKKTIINMLNIFSDSNIEERVCRNGFNLLPFLITDLFLSLSLFITLKHVKEAGLRVYTFLKWIWRRRNIIDGVELWNILFLKIKWNENRTTHEFDLIKWRRNKYISERRFWKVEKEAIVEIQLNNQGERNSKRTIQ